MHSATVEVASVVVGRCDWAGVEGERKEKRVGCKLLFLSTSTPAAVAQDRKRELEAHTQGKYNRWEGSPLLNFGESRL